MPVAAHRQRFTHNPSLVLNGVVFHNTGGGCSGGWWCSLLSSKYWHKFHLWPPIGKNMGYCSLQWTTGCSEIFSNRKLKVLPVEPTIFCAYYGNVLFISLLQETYQSKKTFKKVPESSKWHCRRDAYRWDCQLPSTAPAVCPKFCRSSALNLWRPWSHPNQTSWAWGALGLSGCSRHREGTCRHMFHHLDWRDLNRKVNKVKEKLLDSYYTWWWYVFFNELLLAQLERQNPLGLLVQNVEFASWGVFHQSLLDLLPLS